MIQASLATRTRATKVPAAARPAASVTEGSQPRRKGASRSVGNSSTLRRGPSGGDLPAPGPRHRDVICRTRTLPPQAPDGTERLAAMTPRPETDLLIYHGVLAPRARSRGRVVVYGRRVPEPTAATAPLAGDLGEGRSEARPARLELGRSHAPGVCH